VWDSSCQSALYRPARACRIGKIRKPAVVSAAGHFGQNQRHDDCCRNCAASE
jgi:hypothetical protein